MPYSINSKNEVVGDFKGQHGHVYGHHPNAASAKRQLRALYANASPKKEGSFWARDYMVKLAQSTPNLAIPESNSQPDANVSPDELTRGIAGGTAGALVGGGLGGAVGGHLGALAGGVIGATEGQWLARRKAGDPWIPSW